jgi:hypothetical protein
MINIYNNLNKIINIQKKNTDMTFIMEAYYEYKKRSSSWWRSTR